MHKDDSAVCFGAGMLAGVIAGVIVSVLYAPKSGEETRRTLENTVCSAAQKCTPEILKAKKQAFESIDIMRCKLENQYNKIAEAVRAKQLAKAKEKETIDYEVN